VLLLGGENGYLECREAVGGDGADSGEGHEAGIDCAVAAAPGGHTVFAATQGSAGQAGCRAAEVWLRDLCPRLFLAPPQGLQGGDDAEIARGFLAGEVRGQCGAGQTQSARSEKGGLAGDRALGMRDPAESLCGRGQGAEGNPAGIRDAGCGIRDAGCGIRAAG